MNIKLISLVSGAVLVPSVAIPTSLSLKKDSSIVELESIQEETPQVQDPEQSTKEQQTKPKLPTVEEKALEPFTKNRKAGTNEDYYLSKYRNYFLKPYEDKSQWEAKFKSKQDGGGEIDIPSDYDEDDDDYVTIKRAFDSARPSELGKKNIALNVFCSEAYFETGENDSDVWRFSARSNSIYVDLNEDLFWQLCSIFSEKPENIWEESPNQIAYTGNQIGNLYNAKLMAVEGNDDFWNKRQKEWESWVNIDSDYFQKRQDKKIRDLCREAYEKESGSSGAPTLETVRKYCGLERNF